MTRTYVEVTKDVFYDIIGPLNVHPRPLSITDSIR